MENFKTQSLETITFKKISLEDWEKFREIRLKALQNDPQAFTDNFESESKENEKYWKDKCVNPEYCFYVAEEESIFISMAGSKKIDEYTWMGISGYTLPDFRGRGIFTELINRLIEYTKKAGVDTVLFIVNAKQNNAVKLYKKLGFEIIKEIKNQKMGDGHLYCVYYMKKNIN